EAGSGDTIANLYRSLGVNMLRERATFPDGGNSVEAGVLELIERMQTGRFKIFRHLGDWFEEFRLYHRKDGKLIKLQDDLLSATRYGVMMLRYARTEDNARGRSGSGPRIAHGVDYDPLSGETGGRGGQRGSIDLNGERWGSWGAIRPRHFK